MMRPTTNPARSLSGLARVLDLADASADVMITGITHDSRRVRPGDLYAALPGSTAHGADYAAQAAAAAAAAILTDPAGHARAVTTGLPVLVANCPRDVLGPAAAWLYGEPA